LGAVVAAGGGLGEWEDEIAEMRDLGGRVLVLSVRADEAKGVGSRLSSATRSSTTSPVTRHRRSHTEVSPKPSKPRAAGVGSKAGLRPRTGFTSPHDSRIESHQPATKRHHARSRSHGHDQRPRGRHCQLRENVVPGVSQAPGFVAGTGHGRRHGIEHGRLRAGGRRQDHGRESGPWLVTVTIKESRCASRSTRSSIRTALSRRAGEDQGHTPRRHRRPAVPGPHRPTSGKRARASWPAKSWVNISIV
jgi:hypothetical protein